MAFLDALRTYFTCSRHYIKVFPSVIICLALAGGANAQTGQVGGVGSPVDEAAPLVGTAPLDQLTTPTSS